MRKGKLIKNYIYNTMYQILVLIAPLITTPYVSRVLGVTNIGIFNYAQSIASYFVLVGAVGTSLYGQREMAYLQDKPEERTKAFWEIEIFRIAAVVICTLVFSVVFYSFGTYPDIYLILSGEVFATAFDISWLFMGMENFRLTVIRNAIIKIFGVLCVFLFVKSSNDLAIYTLCMTLPILIGNISLWFGLCKYLVKTNERFTELLIGIKNRIRPIVSLFIPQIAADVYLVLDKTMIGLLATDIDQVGYYSQAQKIVKIALMIVTSLGTVMLPAMSASFAKGDHEGIKKSIKVAFRFIYMLSYALLFGLCAISPWFVPIFFGEGYDLVSPLMITISPILVIIATSNVIGKQYLLPTNQQKVFTISIVAGAGVNFFLNLILIHYFNAIGASIATVLAELTVTMVQCGYVRGELPLQECLLSGIHYLIFGVIMFGIVRTVGYLLPISGVMLIAVMVATGVFVYVVELLITKDPMVKMGLDFMKDKRQKCEGEKDDIAV